MNLSQVSLFVATQSQVKIGKIRAFEEWGKDLTVEEFTERDATLGQSPHAANKKWNMWVLAPRTDPTTDDFFCSCETVEREMVVSPTALNGSSNEQSPDSTNGTAESTKHFAYAIAAVYTPPNHRRKGYARHMMRLLHYVLANQHYRTSTGPFPVFPREQWGEPPSIPPKFGIGIASLLFSDLGPNFYKDCGIGLSPGTGWTVHSPINTIWQVPAQKPDEGHGDYLRNVLRIEWLTEERQAELWDLDAKIIREEIASADTPCVSFLPDQGVAQFQQEISRFYLPSLNTEGIWGAEISARTPPVNTHSDSQSSTNASFITWTLDPERTGPVALVITRLRADNQTFPPLLQAAFHAARNSGLSQVEIWNLDQSLLQVGKDNETSAKLHAQVMGAGVTSERDDRLPSLAWYGEGNVKWRYNEKFCWC